MDLINQIKKIIDSEFSSSLKTRELINLINMELIKEARQCLADDNPDGAKAISSLIIE